MSLNPEVKPAVASAPTASTNSVVGKESSKTKSLLVASAVREFAKVPDFRVSDEFLVALDRVVRDRIMEAQERCRANARITLQACDL